MTVHLPTGRDIVVDSKVPLDAYLTALEAQSDDGARGAPRPPRRAAALAPRQARGQGLPRQARALGGVRRLLRPERGVLRRGARPRPAAARARRRQGRPHRDPDDAARAAARHALRLAPGGGRAVGARDRRGRPRAAQALRDVPRVVLEARAPAHVGDERLQRLGRLARGARAAAAAALRGLRRGVGEGAHDAGGDRQHAARHGGARAGRARGRAVEAAPEPEPGPRRKRLQPDLADAGFLQLPMGPDKDAEAA